MTKKKIVGYLAAAVAVITAFISFLNTLPESPAPSAPVSVGADAGAK